MSARPRQIALLCALAGGFALLGASVNGMVGLDGHLAAATRSVDQERSLRVIDRDCPLRDAERQETAAREI